MARRAGCRAKKDPMNRLRKEVSQDSSLITNVISAFCFFDFFHEDFLSFAEASSVRVPLRPAEARDDAVEGDLYCVCSLVFAECAGIRSGSSRTSFRGHN